ncbi:hypothetical protein P691DRAFT_389941 [Macrolepiota fuliginosa MF-IS2]|uniref:Uncharacterized protein n=1 Tax=Macrolepiota fuliginosa MF-IS2 TaxID=1400762 RepID=A0A9P5X3G4_9AGAR|nr:hypothetical protein P691DRAFT_389941 [Macrolepiota fuliginosa MF-IS2]
MSQTVQTADAPDIPGYHPGHHLLLPRQSSMILLAPLPYTTPTRAGKSSRGRLYTVYQSVCVSHQHSLLSPPAPPYTTYITHCDSTQYTDTLAYILFSPTHPDLTVANPSLHRPFTFPPIPLQR